MGDPPVLDRDRVFIALTRPQMFAGVTYSFFVINIILSVEGFLLFRSPWVLALAGAVHLAGVLACLRDARMVDLWLMRARRAPRVANHRFWRCNSYRA
jgi:type IV secretion system protein VirB3